MLQRIWKNLATDFRHQKKNSDASFDFCANVALAKNFLSKYFNYLDRCLPFQFYLSNQHSPHISMWMRSLRYLVKDLVFIENRFTLAQHYEALRPRTVTTEMSYSLNKPMLSVWHWFVQWVRKKESLSNLNLNRFY